MGRQLQLLDDHTSGNWSLGSNYHPCSQSRKISIGVVVDSVAKTKGKNGKGVVTELRTSQNVTSAKDTPAESKHKGKEVISPDLERQNKAPPCQEPSPRNILHPDNTINHPKKVSILQPNKIVGEIDPDSVFETHKDANEEKSKKNTYQSEVMGRKVSVPASERGNNGNVTLRMKVQELLGTVYSPNKKPYNPETFGVKSKSKSVTNKSDTNSGSLNKRPVTRSKKPQTVPLYQHKETQLDKNVFSFVETWSKKPSTDDVRCTVSKRKEGDTQNQQAFTDVRKRKADTVNVSLKENRRGYIQPNTEMKEKTCQMLNNNKDQDYSSKHSLKSPTTFEFKTAPPRSLFHNNHEDLDVDSLSKRSFKTKGTRNSHSIGFSNANTNNNFTTHPQDSVVKPIMKGSRCSRSSSKYVHSESSEDGSPFTMPVTLEKKNMNGNGGWSISPLSSEDGDEDCENFHDTCSEEDGIAGAVKLFALALERVESKIHSSTSRQSAEILLSVSKNIHSQLQNAESKIQNQVGKLTNLGKSKRMSPENQWQEQQEQLKCIYEKFKEQVDQHLDKCRSTVEGLEAHEVEVRGLVQKQRLSHRKLLMQTEEVIEAQLKDAQKRLADVHRVARDKMVRLKYGIAECLKQGLLGGTR